MQATVTETLSQKGDELRLQPSAWEGSGAGGLDSNAALVHLNFQFVAGRALSSYYMFPEPFRISSNKSSMCIARRRTAERSVVDNSTDS
jgi:hypothetical protein